MPNYIVLRKLRWAAVTPHGDLQVMTSTATRAADGPSWFDSLLFVTLMSGPPRFRGRDPYASLTGAIDLVVIVHVAVWACGALWVLARLYPVRCGAGSSPPSIPPSRWCAVHRILDAVDAGVAGPLLTAYTLGQFAVMLSFTWVFTHRFGAAACLRHLFITVSLLAVAIVTALGVRARTRGR